MEKIVYGEESYAITGACFDVYADKGCGFLEPVYHECLTVEFGLRGFPAISKPSLELSYKGHKLVQTYQPDFVCHGKIIVEIKALSHLTDEHRAQLQNYLRVSGFKLGILVNFGHYPRLEWERFANTDPKEKRLPRLLNDDE
jgi:GxxExxY protein